MTRQPIETLRITHSTSGLHTDSVEHIGGSSSGLFPFFLFFFLTKFMSLLRHKTSLCKR